MKKKDFFEYIDINKWSKEIKKTKTEFVKYKSEINNIDWNIEYNFFEFFTKIYLIQVFYMNASGVIKENYKIYPDNGTNYKEYDLVEEENWSLTEDIKNIQNDLIDIIFNNEKFSGLKEKIIKESFNIFKIDNKEILNLKEKYNLIDKELVYINSIFKDFQRNINEKMDTSLKVKTEEKENNKEEYFKYSKKVIDRFYKKNKKGFIEKIEYFEKNGIFAIFENENEIFLKGSSAKKLYGGSGNSIIKIYTRNYAFYPRLTTFFHELMHVINYSYLENEKQKIYIASNNFFYEIFSMLGEILLFMYMKESIKKSKKSDELKEKKYLFLLKMFLRSSMLHKDFQKYSLFKYILQNIEEFEKEENKKETFEKISEQYKLDMKEIYGYDLEGTNKKYLDILELKYTWILSHNLSETIKNLTYINSQVFSFYIAGKLIFGDDLEKEKAENQIIKILKNTSPEDEYIFSDIFKILEIEESENGMNIFFEEVFETFEKIVKEDDY